MTGFFIMDGINIECLLETIKRSKTKEIKICFRK